LDRKTVNSKWNEGIHSKINVASSKGCFSFQDCTFLCSTLFKPSSTAKDCWKKQRASTRSRFGSPNDGYGLLSWALQSGDRAQVSHCRSSSSIAGQSTWH
jgi:hypothetical protein